MRAFAVSLVVLAAVSLAACASGGSKKPSKAVADAVSGENGLLLSPLADSALPKGSCGMILWTLDAEQPTPIFRAVVEKGADVSLDGKMHKLALQSVNGSANNGISESQVFSDDEVTATVTVHFGQGFDGGSYVEHGILTIERADGWRTVIPAAGIAGCRAK